MIARTRADPAKLQCIKIRNYFYDAPRVYDSHGRHALVAYNKAQMFVYIIPTLFGKAFFGTLFSTRFVGRAITVRRKGTPKGSENDESCRTLQGM